MHSASGCKHEHAAPTTLRKWTSILSSCYNERGYCLTAKSHPEFQWPRDIQRSSIINQNVIDRNRHPYLNSINIFFVTVLLANIEFLRFLRYVILFDFGTYYYGDGIQQRISLLPVTIQNSKLLFDNVVATLVKCQRVRLRSVLAAAVPCTKHASHYFTFEYLLLQRLLRKLAFIKFS